MKFGSGWVIIVMDICFEMSLDLYWYDQISSHNTNIKQNLFLTDLWSSCRSCHLNFLYCYVFYITYVIICLLWNKFILLSHFTQIRRHPLHYHFNVTKKFYLITWNAHFYEGKKIRPSPFFRFTLLQVFNIISHVEDRKSSQQSVQSNVIKIHKDRWNIKGTGWIWKHFIVFCHPNYCTEEIHNKTAPSVWIAVLLLVAQSIPTSGWKMLFDFPLWYRHLIGNRCLSQNIFVTVTTPPSRAPLFIADCALVSLQGLAHLMMGDQGMGSVPFPLCFHCFFLFCSCFESITANDGQMLESCLWLQINTWF